MAPPLGRNTRWVNTASASEMIRTPRRPRPSLSTGSPLVRATPLSQTAGTSARLTTHRALPRRRTERASQWKCATKSP